MDARELLIAARVQLVFSRNPFFANLILPMELVEDAEIPTMATDGESIFYNPEFVKTLTLDQRIGSLKHEGAFHPGLKHLWRRGNREPLLWNIACDYALTPMLSVVERVGMLYDPQFEGRGAEEIYSMLEKSRDKFSIDQEGNVSSGNVGKVGHCGVMKEPAKNRKGKALEGKWERKVAAAVEASKERGDIPGWAEELVGRLYHPKPNAEKVFKTFLLESVPNDYRWIPPDKRFPDFYLPSFSERAKGLEAVIAIDCSGSISSEELGVFFGWVADIREQVYKSLIHLVFFDAEVHKALEITEEDDLARRAYGRGGTDFRPVFELIKMRDWVCPVVVLTDLDGAMPTPSAQPRGEVVWVATTSGRRAKVPFGWVIDLEVKSET